MYSAYRSRARHWYSWPTAPSLAWRMPRTTQVAGQGPGLHSPCSGRSLNHFIYKNSRAHIREIWILPLHFLKEAGDHMRVSNQGIPLRPRRFPPRRHRADLFPHLFSWRLAGTQSNPIQPITSHPGCMLSPPPPSPIGRPRLCISVQPE